MCQRSEYHLISVIHRHLGVYPFSVCSGTRRVRVRQAHLRYTGIPRGSPDTSYAGAYAEGMPVREPKPLLETYAFTCSSARRRDNPSRWFSGSMVTTLNSNSSPTRANSFTSRTGLLESSDTCAKP